MGPVLCESASEVEVQQRDMAGLRLMVPEALTSVEPCSTRYYLLVGFYGEPKVNLFHNIRIK